MAGLRNLFPKIKVSARTRPKNDEERFRQLESDVSELRSALRSVVETLEREFQRDIDSDGVVGRVSPKRGLPKTARLQPTIPTAKRRTRNILPPTIP